MAGALVAWIKRRKVTVLIMIVTFIVSGLLVNLVQLFTLPLYRLNKRLFRVLNARIVYMHWCILPWILENWAEYDIELYGSREEVLPFINKEHALLVLNHRGDLDWMIGWAVIDRMGMLGGTKAIMKDVAKYLPGIGWSFMFMEYPILKRHWDQDKLRLEATCKNLADYPVKMLLCLFAEGTRFTPEKHQLSMEHAKKKGLPILKHHLLPRTKGFCSLLKNMENTLGAVYDITICYRGPREPAIVGVIKAESCAADLFVRRYPLSEVPRGSDEEMSQWLMQRFKEKDELFDYHQLHNKFPGPKTGLKKRPWANLVVLMWVCACSIPLFLLTLYLAWNGMWLVLGMLVLAFLLADRLFQMIARQTEVSKTSSSYGLQPVIKNGSGPPRESTSDHLDDSSDDKKNE